MVGSCSAAAHVGACNKLVYGCLNWERFEASTHAHAVLTAEKKRCQGDCTASGILFALFVACMLFWGSEILSSIHRDARYRQTIAFQAAKITVLERRLANSSPKPAAAAVYPHTFTSAVAAPTCSAHGPYMNHSMHAGESVQRTLHARQHHDDEALKAVEAAASNEQLSTEQHRQLMAELALERARMASLSSRVAKIVAPPAQWHGPLQEDEYPASPQQQPRQQEAHADPQQYKRLAMRASKPQLWQDMVHAEVLEQCVQTFAEMEDFSPAAVATTVRRTNAAGTVVYYTQILIPQQSQQQADPLSTLAVPAAPPANTTCTLQEAPATPLPMPSLQPEEITSPAMSLRALLSCTTTTAAAPAARAACSAQAAKSSGPSCDCASCGCSTAEDVEDLLNKPVDSGLWQALCSLWNMARTVGQAVKTATVRRKYLLGLRKPQGYFRMVFRVIFVWFRVIFVWFWVTLSQGYEYTNLGFYIISYYIRTPASRVPASCKVFSTAPEPRLLSELTCVARNAGRHLQGHRALHQVVFRQQRASRGMHSLYPLAVTCASTSACLTLDGCPPEAQCTCNEMDLKELRTFLLIASKRTPP